MRHRHSIIVFALLAGPGLFAQVTWRRAHGAFGPDQGTRVLVLPGDTTLAVAGTTGSFGPGTGDAYVVMMHTDGDVLASYVFGSPAVEQVGGMGIAADGGLLLAGSTDRNAATGYDGWLMRTDADGLLQWEITVGGTDWDFLESLEPTADGGWLAAGRTQSFGAGGMDGWLVRFDANGDTAWTAVLGTPQEDRLTDARETSDGGLVACGMRTTQDGDADAWVVKLAADRSVEWQSFVGGDSTDLARDVIVTADGGYSIVGTTRSYSPFVEHLHAKLDANGAEQWRWNWGQVNDQEAYEHLQLADGTYLAAGYTRTSGGGGSDMFLLSSDQGGYFTYGRTFGGVDDDEAFGLDTLPDGYLVAGRTRSYGAGNTDVFVVRTGLDGLTDQQTVEETFDALPLPVSPDPAPVLAVFPMPAEGPFTVQASDVFVELTVHDAVGRLIWAAPVRGQSASVREALPMGAHVLTARLADGRVLRRSIIVQRP